jgi:hypothetical protein
MAKFDQIMKVLAILGGLIALIVGLLDLVGLNYGLGASWAVPYLFPIVAIILGIVVLLSAFKGSPVPFTAVWLLVLGILILIFWSWLAAVLVIIAGILGFLN